MAKTWNELNILYKLLETYEVTMFSIFNGQKRGVCFDGLVGFEVDVGLVGPSFSSNFFFYWHKNHNQELSLQGAAGWWGSTWNFHLISGGALASNDPN